MVRTSSTLGEQLLEAQVRFHLARLTGDELTATVTRVAEGVLDSAGDRQIADLVDASTIKDIVSRALVEVPGSPAVAGFVELAREIAQVGPVEPFALADVVDREQVERVLDGALELTPALGRAMERLTASPLVGATATRFMGRVVGEALAANQAMADKVPGLGSIMSFGTRAAGGVVGAADKQLGGLLADTAGKGGTVAVRRLNRIIVETLEDPVTRDAVLQVWDLIAAEPFDGLDHHAHDDQVAGVLDAARDLVVTTLATPQIVAIGHAVVDGFFESFGGYTPAELLDELNLDRTDLIADVAHFAPAVVQAMTDTGDLERLLRAELAPFYASDEVSDLLGT
ncbi:hypothetical protein [Aeromicrobium sp. CF3.5]|uniref:hypothetical protein n=1 Tax=Aeromicrobium sp. CF3.5 TaxID=3373078 RepID=UPI003EE68615